MKAKWNLLIVLALLLGLAVASPEQPVSAAAYVATFYFTSSANPSRQYQAVTFTVSATGTDPAYPPFGTVTFYDNGQPINCEGEYYSYYQVKLNLDGSFNPVRDVPAVCKTSALAPGFHTITAEFSSQWPPSYGNASLTLAGGQTVNPPIPLTIGPDTLPNGIYGLWYQQALTAVSDDGYSCGSECWWTVEGSFPAGVFNYGSVGMIEGTPEQFGDFTFTITAKDIIGGYEGSRTYTFTISKATPVINIFSIGFTPNDELYLQAYVNHPNNSYTYPSGLVSFSVNGIPLEACSGANAKPVDSWGFATCIAPPPTGLAPGTYPLLVEFISSEAGYNSTSIVGTVTLPVRIDGLIFEDLDLDGVRDPETEMPVPNYWQVNLDQGCDGTIEDTVYTGNSAFTFDYLTPGSYCLIVPLGGNWRQTTTLGEFTVNENQYIEIGVTYVQLAFSPEVFPNGAIGEPYNQAVSVSGGEPPYTLIEQQGSLPAGLTFDPETLTVSGTPTAAGYGWLYLLVQDAHGAAGYYQVFFLIQTDGSFNLTSDANPSASGQAVTFTFTGSGDVFDPNFGGVIVPSGTVSFYDGDTAIAGCVDVLLNYDQEVGVIDLPAVCTTSALTDGAHAIRAAFSSQTVYADASLTLTQQVGPLDTTTFIFLPVIMGRTTSTPAMSAWRGG